MKSKENIQGKNDIRKEMLKQSKGITLIALIVTIIIMLILAGVTINIALGDNGLFSKSKEAVERHKEEAAREKISMAIGEYMLDINTREMTEEEKDNRLKEILSNVGKTSVASDDKYYEIDVDGNIFWVNKETQEIISKGKTNGTEEKLEPKEVTSISLNPTTLIVNIGETVAEAIEVTYEPEEAERKTVTWESNNTQIATVDNEGKVTGVAGGTTIITATTANGKTATCTVTVKDEEATTKRVGDITITPKYDYGKVVTGYDSKTSEITWRLWYVDNVSASDKSQDTVYLIGDFITTAQAPTKTVNGTTYTLNGGINDKCSCFTNMLPAYTHNASTNNIGNASKWIWDNQQIIVTKWLSQWYNYGSHKTTGDNNNMKAVAYMLDSTIWTNAFGDDSGTQANYVLGGPTTEMYCASYKDSHPSKYLASRVNGDTGYEVAWNENGTIGSYSYNQGGVDTTGNNKIYAPGSSSYPVAMWLASPSSISTNSVMYAGYNGYVDYIHFNYTSGGFCPVVSLKSGVQIVPDGNGYRIQ